MINVEKIEKIYNKCVINNKGKDNASIKNITISIKSINGEVIFNANKILKCKKYISAIINQLIKEQNINYSFTDFCIDWNKEVWADSVETCEKLMLLGIASGKLEYTLEPSESNLPNVIALY